MIIRHDEQVMAQWRPGVRTRLQAGEALGSTLLCVGEQWFEPGTSAPLHRHPGVEEIVTVLSGQAEFQVGEKTCVLGPSTSIVLAPGSVHGFSNASTEILHVIGIYSAGAPPTIYEDAPDVVVEIAGVGGEQIDATRVQRVSMPPTSEKRR